jgi:hypothetical protein
VPSGIQFIFQRPLRYSRSFLTVRDLTWVWATSGNLTNIATVKNVTRISVDVIGISCLTTSLRPN